MVETPLFKFLSPTEREAIWARTTGTRFGAGERIFSDGDPGDAIYIIRRGKVAIKKRHSSGTEREIAVLGEGEIFGEMSLLADEPRSASAVAKTAVELRRLSRQEFDQLLDANDITCYKMYRTLALTLHARLAAVNNKVMDLLSQPENREEFAMFKEKLLSVWSE